MMDLHIDSISTSEILEHPLLLFYRLDAFLRAPLKRRMRLRNKIGSRTGSFDVLVVFGAAKLANLATKLGNSDDVLIRLSGQPDHEVHLHRRPALFKRD